MKRILLGAALGLTSIAGFASSAYALCTASVCAATIVWSATAPSFTIPPATGEYACIKFQVSNNPVKYAVPTNAVDYANTAARISMAQSLAQLVSFNIPPNPPPGFNAQNQCGVVTYIDHLQLGVEN